MLSVTGVERHDYTVALWLPLNSWNGRFHGTGGGGFVPGRFAAALAPALKDGYAARRG